MDAKVGASSQREAALGREENRAALLNFDLSRGNRPPITRAGHAIVKWLGGIWRAMKSAVHVIDEESRGHCLLGSVNSFPDQNPPE